MKFKEDLRWIRTLYEVGWVQAFEMWLWFKVSRWLSKEKTLTGTSEATRPNKE